MDKLDFEFPVLKDSGTFNLIKARKTQVLKKLQINDSVPTGSIQIIDDSYASEMNDYMIDVEQFSDEAHECGIQIKDEEESHSSFESSESSNHSDHSKVSVLSNLSDSDTSQQDLNLKLMGNQPMNKINLYMQDFYDRNYFKYEMLKIPDYQTNRVWNCHFDQFYDQIILFVASIKVISGDPIHNFEEQFARQKNSLNKYKRELESLQVYNSCRIQLILTFQIWNIDDRKLRDNSHQKKPSSEKETLKVEESIQGPINLIDMMNYFKEKYGDYAQIFQNHNQVYFFNHQKFIANYHISHQIINTQNRIRIFDKNFFPQTFKALISYKDIGKVTESEDQLKVFSYHQQKDPKYENLNDIDSNAILSDNTDEGDSTDGKNKMMKSAYFQTITLHMVKFSNVQENLNINNSSSAAYLSYQHERPLKTYQLKIDDENVIQYYNQTHSKQINKRHPFFLKRIDDSNTYIMLFPTGLLLMIGISPFAVQSKLQLNLKSDEHIIDYSYCISQDGKNQCIWIIDSKLQVWRCINERNPNLCNWSMQKKIIFGNLQFKAFFQPAMTFEDFYMASSFNKIRCFKQVRRDHNEHMEYQFAYNGTSTKSVIVQQTYIQPSLADTDSFYKEIWDQNCVVDFIEGHYKQQRIQFQQNQVRVIIIAKSQSIIVNEIPLKMMSKKQIEIFNKKFSQDQRNLNLRGIPDDQQKRLLSLKKMQQEQHENEIIEIIHMGRVDYKSSLLSLNPTCLEEKSRLKFLRQFLVRRRKSLEIMLTNGIHHWVKPIDKSETNRPYVTHKVQLSQNNEKIIIYYDTEKQEGSNKQFFRTFVMNSDNLDYEIQMEDDINSEMKYLRDKSQNHYAINQHDQVVEIRLEFDQELRKLQDLKKIMDKLYFENERNQIHVKMPRNLIPKELLSNNQFDDIFVSKDDRLIMSGKVIIQLDENLSQIENMGSILILKTQSSISFKFLSFFEEKSRKQILLAHNNNNKFIQFSPDQHLPISSNVIKDVIYFVYNIVQMQQNLVESSIIRFETDTLKCFEIYKSKEKIVNLAIIQDKQFSSPGSNASEQFPSKGSSDGSLMGISQEQSQTNQIYLSACSQTMDEINIEIIKDNSQELQERDKDSDSQGFQKSIKNVFKRMKTKTQIEESEKQKVRKTLVLGQLVFYISLIQREEILVSSEIGWVTIDKLILTINNKFYLINLEQNQLSQSKNLIDFGTQMVNMGQFASIVKISESHDSSSKPKNSLTLRSSQFSQTTDRQEWREQHCSKNHNEQLLKASKSIQRMDIASLTRFAFLTGANLDNSGILNTLMFFLPCEELNGGSIFTKLAFDLNIIQPYLEKIDVEFINLMNTRIRNVKYFMNQKMNNQFSMTVHSNAVNSQNLNEMSKSRMVNPQNMLIHMYQEDISGFNAIDKAYQKNSIFCIKAFVDNLLQLSVVQKQFQNCFDKALLMMIDKEVDVNELVKSDIFYGNLWSQYTIFSDKEYCVVKPYNNDLEDLEDEEPENIFYSASEKKVQASQKLEAKADIPIKSSITFNFKKAAQDQDQSQNYHQTDKPDEQIQTPTDQHEVQFKYIYLEKIQGKEKINLIKSLMNCKDLTLFEQEPIQLIIDYKWNTYTKRFFQIKLIIYTIFILVFYYDLVQIPAKKTLHPNVLDSDFKMIYNIHVEGQRVKNWEFYVRKAFCQVVQLGFLMYEFSQFVQMKFDYLQDFWNYFEVIGILLILTANVLDIIQDETSDFCRLLFVLSILFALVKILFLIRVSRQLSFLVMMIIQVIFDVRYYMVLFFLFISIFAQCYHLVSVDYSTYGRIPEMLAMGLATLRSAMGDFSVLDMRYGFDAMNSFENEEGEVVYTYKQSKFMVLFTYFIFMLVGFFQFMIFMNFIIAVIGKSYQSIITFSVAHDYLQRTSMIYEREIQFKNADFDNPIYFPNILVVRQMKKENIDQHNWLTQMKNLKQTVKDQTHINRSFVEFTTNDLKDHLSNSIKVIESDISHINRDMENMFLKIQKIQAQSKKQITKQKSTNKDSQVQEQEAIKVSQLKQGIDAASNQFKSFDQSRNRKEITQKIGKIKNNQQQRSIQEAKNKKITKTLLPSSCVDDEIKMIFSSDESLPPINQGTITLQQDSNDAQLIKNICQEQVDIKKTLKTILEIQNIMSTQQHLTSEVKLENRPRLPILSSLIQNTPNGSLKTLKSQNISPKIRGRSQELKQGIQSKPQLSQQKKLRLQLQHPKINSTSSSKNRYINFENKQ